MATALQIVEDEVRELVRRRDLDPALDTVAFGRLIDEVLTEYQDRAVNSPMPPLGEPKVAARAVLDLVAGFGPLQPLLDDPGIDDYR